MIKWKEINGLEIVIREIVIDMDGARPHSFFCLLFLMLLLKKNSIKVSFLLEHQ